MRKKFSMDRFHTAHTLFFCKNSPNPQTDFEKTVPAKGWRNNAMVLAIALLSFTPLHATPVPLLPGKEFRFVLPPGVSRYFYEEKGHGSCESQKIVAFNSKKRIQSFGDERTTCKVL